MAFADARGIPVVNDEGKMNGKNAKDSIEKTLKDYSSNKKDIPYLHDLIAKWIPKNPNAPNETELLRTLIQSYNGNAFNNYNDFKNNTINENYPRYGIDANRDVRKSLLSTQCFENFVFSMGTNTNTNVFMIHGYVGEGKVFGPYYLNNYGQVRMTDKVKKYVNYILETIINGRYNIKYSDTTLKPYDKDGDKGFYYITTPETPQKNDTIDNPYKYAGEWSYLLYGIKKVKSEKILCFDIELPNRYRQGTRDDKNKDNYEPNKVGENKLPFFKDDNGVIVEKKESFYKLLKEYYIKREEE